MERLDGALRGALRGAGVPDAGALADVTRLWPSVVGDAIARASWPQRISRDGTLQVAASSSTWAFELGLLADQILEKLAAEIGTGSPTAIRFAPGPVPAQAAPLPSEARSTPRQTVPVAPCPIGCWRTYEFPTHRPLRSMVDAPSESACATLLVRSLVTQASFRAASDAPESCCLSGSPGKPVRPSSHLW